MKSQHKALPNIADAGILVEEVGRVEVWIGKDDTESPYCMLILSLVSESFRQYKDVGNLGSTD